MTPQQLVDDVTACRVVDFGLKDCIGVQKYLAYVLSPYRLDKKPNQLILEFGVYNGYSLHMISTYVYPNLVYGFDTFTGLPEDWVNVNGEIIQPKGHFKLPVEMLPVETETKKYVAGPVQDTYRKFLSEHPEPIQFMHVDLDLYNPCLYALEESTTRLKKNSIVVVDDIANYNGWEVNAAKAFCEWVMKYNVKYEPIATCGWQTPSSHASAAFRILHDFC